MSGGLPSSWFASDEIRPREVTLGDGTKHTLHFRQPLQKFYTSIALAEGEQAREEAQSRLIAYCVVNPDGSDALTPATAARLLPMVQNAIIGAIHEVAKPQGNT